MTVVERVRELGLLRAAGATRGQLTSYILLQASVIGVVGAGLGIVAGGVLAAGIAAWMGSVGSVPIGGPVVRLSDALAALVIGLGVTLAAAIEPARRAGRVSPGRSTEGPSRPAAGTTRPTSLADRGLRRRRRPRAG